ncbi:hypothetical protein MPL1032_130347 [Mesorhizobium plurifarium]|uniref:Uncharacterized protein n=1 Tax=Mesorhizobium plurifarium TaxID=69974 RepID=A0A0K2VRQ4_MESPL|nr:hypothetical protein MPL1032_130347 [Mesorhizobium plurifarium]
MLKCAHQIPPRLTTRNRYSSSQELVQAIRIGKYFRQLSRPKLQIAEELFYPLPNQSSLHPPDVAYERLPPLPCYSDVLEAGNRIRLCHCKMSGKEKPLPGLCDAANI